MRDGETFLNGLRDEREVWYRGERVEDVVEHEVLGTAARHVAADFDLQLEPEHRDLAVTTDHAGRSYSTFWHVPRSSDDLARRSRLIEASTAHGATLVSLAREIGSDASFALQRVMGGSDPEAERVATFLQRCRDEDLAVAVAQTDVKGDRSLRPSKQADPDLYLRVVDRRDDGIVVRGAKAHTSCSPYVDELMVIPTRALSPDEQDWAVAFAETVRGLTQLAAMRARLDPATGFAYPDPLTTNLAKWTFAREYARAVEHVIDIAGGLLATGPGDADWASPELRPYFDKYLGAAVPAEQRLALLNLASELTARDYAGYQSVLAVHAEGSLEAEKLMLNRSYDPKPALDFVRRLTGVAPRAAQEVTATS